VGLEVDEYSEKRDWLKSDHYSSLTRLFNSRGTHSQWPATFDQTTSNHDLDREVDFDAHLASRVHFVPDVEKVGMFSKKREPWYQPDKEDLPK
jgi:hypothetical protein